MLKTFFHSLEQTKISILPALVELTNDEQSSVRLAGLETIVQILSLLDEGTFKINVAQIQLHNLDMLLWCVIIKITINQV